MPKVKFINVGRNSLRWEADCDGEVTYEWLYGQVQSRKALRSNDVEFYKDGSITSGYREVGRFEVIEQ